MLLTQSDEDAARARVLSLHGLSSDAWKRFNDARYAHYEVVDCGFKFNMMDIQAALGLRQLVRLDANWRRRQEIWSKYDSNLSHLPIALPPTLDPASRHGYHLYTILVEEERCGVSRDVFLEELARRNIGAGVHYRSLPEHAYYQQRFGWRPEDYPAAATVGRSTVSLPLSTKLTGTDTDDVIEAVADILKEGGRA